MTSVVAADEARRLAAVRRYDILDTPPDGAFDRVTALAARLFDVPISIVSIVDEDRIWFKSVPGRGERARHRVSVGIHRQVPGVGALRHAVQEEEHGVSASGGRGREVAETADLCPNGRDVFQEEAGGDQRALVVDMNFADNPSCAYDKRWACPLAPPGNTLSAPLRAGELTINSSRVLPEERRA